MAHGFHFYMGYAKASRYTLSYPQKKYYIRMLHCPNLALPFKLFIFPKASFRGTLPKSAHLFTNTRHRSSFPSALTNNLNYIPSIGCIPHINPNATSKNDYFQHKNIPNLK